MNIYELSFPHSLIKDDIPDTVSAIGFFDGIHRGHQKVINEAIRRAEENNMESAVITFHPHPLVVLKGEHHVNYITPLKEKIEIMKGLGVDRLYIIDFNKEFSKLSPQEFVDQFIIGLNIKHLVAGFDYTFGHKGKGNMENISEYTRDKFSYTTVEKVSLDHEKVSSTRIRKLLREGNIEEANELLTRPFKLRGIVIRGDQRGREIGFPTANLQVDKQALLPKPGIYAVKVLYKNETYFGMASIGTNPTFTAEREDLSIEVNILDYNNNLYGQELTVEWYKYMREEEKFDSVEALIEQIKLDEVNIRRFFSI
ncbi:bifunctional riboflavin kinase/FAD synthetase [Oceanobacillus caeni]|uniref:bifunctional riboflavin kinase/FAD synthetase n=1 Tax=Oceanobacillus TaxID=182709 RepID=UPI000620FE55|nr:bifunctional riboflavin kinase/FAD synthetase [Oceanobacillus caeni]KKE78409.1 riboflavin biosynthesis protein RibF [Bacilli bacterium VT-13-104]PZD88635.1 bifunctional riboflavin kinase/FAD synthetase [Bacilli bacterium]MCR1833210.1 bifunctional riboflavin kinase/FAD synthetase [Oceanobacillus caeni]PZD89927.1 bifunctional riboflavin kinase/FAD synthetase [Bacilli bacterium]PZD91997.1 bifunctional riboflavin kinase/FAD synthetase [Bacilli bacterium]